MSISLLFLLFMALELFESNWQKSDTFYGLIENNYKIYSKNLILYFLLNPTFIYSVFLAFYLNNFTIWLNAIIVLKFLDIMFKLTLMKKISNNEAIETIIPVNMEMSYYLRYLNVLIYPSCFLVAVLV